MKKAQTGDIVGPRVAATIHVCVDVEPGMRTAAAVAWEAAAKISLLVLALSLLDGGCCSSVQQHRVLQQHVLLLLLLLLRALQQHEEVVVHRKPSDRVVGGAELCVVDTGYVCLMCRKQLSHGIQTGKKQRKTNN